MLHPILIVGALVVCFLVLYRVTRPRAEETVPASLNAIASAKTDPTRRSIKVLATVTDAQRSDRQNEVAAINAIRLTCPQHDLRAAKYIVEHLPQTIATQLPAEQAESIRHQLEAAGLTVQVS